MASLEKYVLNKNTPKQATVQPTVPQGRVSVQPLRDPDMETRLDDLRAVFPNESEENFQVFAHHFASRDEMDLAVRQLVDDGSSISQYLIDWQVVTGRKKRAGDNSKRGKQGRKSDVTRASYPKPQASPTSGQSTARSNHETSIKPAPQPSTQSTASATAEQKKRINFAEDSSSDEEDDRLISTQPIFQNKPQKQEAGRPEVGAEISIQLQDEFSEVVEDKQYSAVLDQKIRERKEFGVQTLLATKEAGVQADMTQGIPCLIYPLNHRDMFKLSDMVYQSQVVV